MTTRIDLELWAALLRARLGAVDNEDLVLDLLEWLAAGPRGYSEVMDAWRTSCPRLPVWEEATDRGLLARHRGDGGALISLTPIGRKLLDDHRPHLRTIGNISLDIARRNFPREYRRAVVGKL